MILASNPKKSERGNILIVQRTESSKKSVSVVVFLFGLAIFAPVVLFSSVFAMFTAGTIIGVQAAVNHMNTRKPIPVKYE